MTDTMADVLRQTQYARFIHGAAFRQSSWFSPAISSSYSCTVSSMKRVTAEVIVWP